MYFRSSFVSLRLYGSVVLLIALVPSCDVNEGIQPPVSPEECLPELKLGQWDPTIIDWSDVGDAGPDIPKPPPDHDIEPHHPSLTAVHAAHLPSGEFMMFHGQSEERVWPIGAPATEIRWHPVPFKVANEECPGGGTCYANLFCSGHVGLPDGRFFVAGGNVTGRGREGGLFRTFTFDPNNAKPDVNPYGWAQHGNMAADRWYPTLTVIPGADPRSSLGRVLISSGASRRELKDGQNTFELYDPAINYPFGEVSKITIEGDPPFSDTNPIPLYPFMFLLSNGDIFFAGGDGSDFHTKGRVLIPDYNNNGKWAWHPAEFTGSISGGSAVTFRPGWIMRAGGVVPDGPDDQATSVTEWLDLSQIPSGQYALSIPFQNDGDMLQKRRFHTLTLLADGRVAATGGNTVGFDKTGDHYLNRCNFPENGPEISSIECNNDSACPALICVNSSNCSQCPSGDDSECPLGSRCDADRLCYVPCEGGPFCRAAVGSCIEGKCDPANVACFATKSAEIWDPDCKFWTELGTQKRERMYHSTALLLPDANVISMGGGHERGNGMRDLPDAEVFVPEYGSLGTANVPVIQIQGPTDMTFGKPVVPWNDDLYVLLSNSSPTVVPDYFTLVRLGSVTHGFDMDQRWMKLEILEKSSTFFPNELLMTVQGPKDSDFGLASFSAPPGYYMLFLRTKSGEVSQGQYVKVGPGTSASFACPASSALVAKESSCFAEPVGGHCPRSSIQVDDVALPSVDTPLGLVNGWRILVPAGDLTDHGRNLLPLSARELTELNARCTAACEAEYRSNPAISTNCSAPNAFGAPIYLESDTPGPYDLVLPSQKQGQGIFPGESLSCNLDSTCCSAFDEDLCAATPDRTTPANDLLGVGEEYKVTLGPKSKIEIITNQGKYTSQLNGSVGYSFCSAGSASTPCPFYVGSFHAQATSPLTPSMTCADGTTAQVSIANLVVKLGQPAFGIARSGVSAKKGFPKGGLIFETAFDVGPLHVVKRRPTREDVVIIANKTNFHADDLVVSMTVPCNTSTASITAKLSAHDASAAGALKPPVVKNMTAQGGTCGAARALQAVVSDPDGDAGPLRWKVDGVLLAPGTNSMVVTGTHVVEAVTRDSRGATTTDTRVITCL